MVHELGAGLGRLTQGILSLGATELRRSQKEDQQAALQGALSDPSFANKNPAEQLQALAPVIGAENAIKFIQQSRLGRQQAAGQQFLQSPAIRGQLGIAQAPQAPAQVPGAVAPIGQPQAPVARPIGESNVRTPNELLDQAASIASAGVIAGGDPNSVAGKVGQIIADKLQRRAEFLQQQTKVPETIRTQDFRTVDSADDTLDLTTQIFDLVTDESQVGFLGGTLESLQGLGAQGSAIFGLLQTEKEKVIAEALANGDALDIGALNDPNRTAGQVMLELLAYSIAGINNEGRKSNEQIQQARKLVGVSKKFIGVDQIRTRLRALERQSVKKRQRSGKRSSVSIPALTLPRTDGRIDSRRLVKGIQYQTPKGLATWTGKAFRQ